MDTRAIPSTGDRPPVIGCGTWLGFDVGGKPHEIPQRAQVLAALFDSGKLLKVLRQQPLPGWAQEIGCASWNQLLLKFVLSQPAVTCVIPGTSRPDHMRDNAAAGTGVRPGPDFWNSRLPDLGL